MKRVLLAVLAISLMLLVSGCGSSSNTNTFVSSILSLHISDAEVEDTGTSIIRRQGNLSFVRAGIDPAVNGSEFGAFLVFPLNDAGGVPSNAIIDKATLEVFVNRLTLQQSAVELPIQIELIATPGRTLTDSFFTTPAAHAIKLTKILPADVNGFVAFNVTDLMVRAQLDGLSDFQVRILQDLTPPTSNGVVEIEDAITARAPLLEVVWH
jgi:hypothetical protein